MEYKTASVNLRGEGIRPALYYSNVYACGLIKMNDETLLRVTYQNDKERITRYFRYDEVLHWSVTE